MPRVRSSRYSRGGPRGSVGDPKSLAGGEGRVRRTQGGGGDGGSLGEPSHALHPACGDRPDIGAFDANRDPWAGDLEGLGREGTVATARAGIIGCRRSGADRRGSRPAWG